MAMGSIGPPLGEVKGQGPVLKSGDRLGTWDGAASGCGRMDQTRGPLGGLHLLRVGPSRGANPHGLVASPSNCLVSFAYQK
ncbi:hypothetical protein GOBAR_AA29514 [Gossypium barbadense]|uniref:Uncharacterized protein n=2 Tax=Gossypium TaxID=3633 RepID=A0A2P5WJ90_GOSBA|nr:hypothetical protein PVK06_037461 [Gossypium arboreum]PPR91158.1 hypothetical protein GOBAR_AA29513 [Gossypium barbadense]PPR91159.1 hypothetical protein GOBAR_AA29514 [Gossypium barbadense]